MKLPNIPSIYLILGVGVTAISFSAIFIRLADAPPLVIASYRMTISSVVMATLMAGARCRNRVNGANGLTMGDLPLLGFSSVCLALHFWFWIVSLDYTSVANSVMLVTTSPLMVAIASRLLLAEPLYRYRILGIGVGMIGGVVIALGDAVNDGHLFGDAMAFSGAFAIVGYMLAGRKLRTHMAVLTYTTMVYSGSALLLIVATIVAGEPFTGYTFATYVMFVLLALVPQVVGHSILNWSLAHVSATAVAISVMAEPVIVSVIAFPVLNELPSLTSVAGGLLILTGILLAMRAGSTGQLSSTGYVSHKRNAPPLDS